MEQEVRIDSYEEQEIDLVEILQYLWKRLPMIAVAAFVGAAVTLLASFTLVTPVYESTTQLYMYNGKSSNASAISSFLSSSNTDVSTDYAELLKTKPVLREVVQTCHLDVDVSDASQLQAFADRITVAPGDSKNVMKISVQAKEPKQAKEIADCVTNLAIKDVTTLIGLDQPKIVEQAEVATIPANVHLLKNTLLGFVACGILCGFVYTLLYILDEHVKNKGEVEKIFGTATLAVVPGK